MEPTLLDRIKDYVRLAWVDMWLRVLAVVASVIGILVLLLLESCGDNSDFVSKHGLLSQLALGILVAIAGFGGLFTKKAIRRRRVDLASTSIALGALVRPLLGVELTLRELDRDPTPLMTYARAEREYRAERGATSSPLKWTRTLLMMDSRTSEPGRVNERGTCRLHEFIGQRSTGREIVLNESQLVTEWELIIDECTREVAGSVRDWAPLLTLSDSGEHALYCLQSLRVDLQDLLRRLAVDGDGETSLIPSEVTKRELRRMRFRTSMLAVTFEDASFPKGRRWEVHHSLETARRQWETNKAAHDCVDPTVRAFFDDPAGAGGRPGSSRTKRQRRAQSWIQRLARYQDHRRVKAESSRDPSADATTSPAVARQQPLPPESVGQPTMPIDSVAREDPRLRP